MANISNIFIDQGADFTTTLTVTDSNGDAVKFIKYSVAAQIRKTFLSSTATSFTTTYFKRIIWCKITIHYLTHKLTS